MRLESFGREQPVADYDKPEHALSVVRKPIPHDSSRLQVQGLAPYIDDLPEPAGCLHLAIGGAPKAAGKLLSLDLSAVQAYPGVIAVITARDVPGRNDISPVAGDEPAFAESGIFFHQQPLFAVAAETRDTARRAARLAKVEIAATAPLVTVADAIAADSMVQPDYAFTRGKPAEAIAASPHRLEGQFHIGGQEHFYLEGQIAMAIPGEGQDIHVISSTQHPTEIQHVVARVLGLPDHAVVAEVRRMGGGFGGKESQATQWAAIAALAARKTGRPCKLRLDRDDDMAVTGKRHDFRVDYAVGFEADGAIRGISTIYNARAGCSLDLTSGVVDRTMFHADNSYWLPECDIRSRRLKTNTVSNTAFRGFGGPQGMLGMERIIDAIAWATGRDPLDIRKANLYAQGRDVTPYGQHVADNIILPLVETLEQTSEYRRRRREIEAFNASSPILKRGIALTPVKFGISFTLSHLNQAGALVHVYQDGSVMMNHGGTEMGQGLFLKVAQVVAEEFGVGIERVKITATRTDKVPNTAPTAASAGSDLNGMASRNAARVIKERLTAFAAEIYGVDPARVRFRNGMVFVGDFSLPFGELTKKAVLARISLSSTGFYRTPDITWDRAKATGNPFYYFAYGACCSEAEIDTMTGENRVSRVDILHDVGRSLNPAIDIGQIEGGFVQGMGWLTTEELVYDAEGRLRTHAPSTYKIPVASDIPADFRVALWDGYNSRETIYASKAVGEPPVMLAIAVFSALADACEAAVKGAGVRLHAPATPEAVLRAVQGW
ncbi:MAG: xanthine dehydrogenase molybdopterin binding subunit [Methylocystis sp.]|nr:xanthine dehydrogenase molybdopterin binding subunit [Methylocystis sp.]